PKARAPWWSGAADPVSQNSPAVRCRHGCAGSSPPRQSKRYENLDRCPASMSPRSGIPYGMKRGQLRIYLGAARGGGKTYSMLGEGHRRPARATDVVVGFAETYNRKLTPELLGGLEIVPRRAMTYRGSTFEEMDLDAV